MCVCAKGIHKYIQTMKLNAFYIAEQINLKALRQTFSGALLLENSSELFYRIDDSAWCYVFDYGVVAFANMSDVDQSRQLAYLQTFLSNPLPEPLQEHLDLLHTPDQALDFGFDQLRTPRLDDDIIRVALLNTAQSAALDYYNQRAEVLLAEIRQLTQQMEEKGAINTSRKNMVRYIGRALNQKNRIVENLYIFDSPELTWEDENLDRVHRGLERMFELKSRFREVEYTYKVVEDNLAVLREFYLHAESSRMEWIIIILILIEVFDLLISKFV
jgi:required for meiotic nuclear division protein 1